METLADRYLRAVRAVRAVRLGEIATAELEELEQALLHEVIPLQRRFPGGPAPRLGRPMQQAERAAIRAYLADDAVRLRWWAEQGFRRAEQQLAQLDRDRAIAEWAAGAIARASFPRVTMRALEAEPTAAQLADWLEEFSKALGVALRPTIAIPGPVFGEMLDLFGEGTTERAVRSPSDAEKVLELQRREMARDRTFRTFAA